MKLRNLTPPRVEHKCFSGAHGTLPKTNYADWLKTISRYCRWESCRSYLLDYGGIKLEIINSILSRKCPNIWKLNSALLNNPWVKEEITGKLGSAFIWNGVMIDKWINVTELVSKCRHTYLWSIGVFRQLCHVTSTEKKSLFTSVSETPRNLHGEKQPWICI